MIVLDTNVISELIKVEADPRVVRWLDGLETIDLWVSAVTAAEMRLGVALLPEGRRRRALGAAVEDVLTDDFEGRVLAFDDSSTGPYANLRSERAAAGLPVRIADAMIAASCLAYGATLATRNIKDFEGTGVDLVNPWEA